MQKFLYICVFIISIGQSNILLAESKKPQKENDEQKLCSDKKPSIITQFEVQGKLGFSQNKKGGSAYFIWIEDGQNFNIRLYGPFGTGSVWIQGLDKDIVLTDAEGKTFIDKSAEGILKKVTGWEIPISGLRFWLKGKPAPHSHIYSAEYDHSNHQLISFKQDKWHIQYHDYRKIKKHFVPKGLTLQRGDLKLNIIFKRWELYR